MRAGLAVKSACRKAMRACIDSQNPYRFSGSHLKSQTQHSAVKWEEEKWLKIQEHNREIHKRPCLKIT